MLIGNISTIPSIVNLPGQGGGIQPFQSTEKFLFDGDDGFLRSVTQSNYRFTDELTLSCWVTFGDSLFDFTQSQKNFMIIDQADNNFSNGYSVYVTRAPNNNAVLLRFSIGQVSVPNPQTQRAQINITNLRTSKDQVFFIMATFKDQNVQLFLKAVGVDFSNNKQPSSSTISYTQQTNTFCIGNTSPQANSEFDGSIDEVGVWNNYLNAANANALFDWDQNGDLEKYSTDNGYNLEGWYRMGENATYVPNTTTYDVLAEDDDFIITEDGISVVTENFVEDLGVWTVKSATDLSDTSKYLVSSRPADLTIGYLPPTARKQPGLPPPT